MVGHTIVPAVQRDLSHDCLAALMHRSAIYLVQEFWKLWAPNIVILYTPKQACIKIFTAYAYVPYRHPIENRASNPATQQSVTDHSNVIVNIYTWPSL